MELTPERRDEIVNNYVKNQIKRKLNPQMPTAEKRREWNQKYYQKCKLDPNWSQSQKDLYAKHAEKKKEKQKWEYYKRTNRLDTLKTKYPDIYNKYMVV
tara:strand:- start:560 stop:856 length:297 start_codon:yes stop_codon:yes gene_type:complete